jgi:hypothetical protein
MPKVKRRKKSRKRYNKTNPFALTQSLMGVSMFGSVANHL